MERATLTADITPGQKVVRFSDEVYPSEPPPLVVTNRQAGRRSHEDDPISHTTFTQQPTTTDTQPATTSGTQPATTTDTQPATTSGTLQATTARNRQTENEEEETSFTT